MDKDELRLIFEQSTRVLLELLDDRGYDIKKIKIPNKIESFHFHIESDNKLGLIFYETSLRFSKDQLKRSFINIKKYYGKDIIASKKEVQILIIILDVSKSRLEDFKEQFTKEYIPSLNAEQIELWDVRKLRFNVTRNIFVPKHQLMTETEIKNEIDIPRNKLKKIRNDDPQVLYIGGKKNQIVRILRQTLTSGILYDYRLII